MNTPEPEKTEALKQAAYKQWFQPSIGCMIAGFIGIIKALDDKENATGVFVCLLASVIAFVAAYYLRARHD